ncbi:phage tail spike protein [Streptococcus suis]|uniref:phage tail spike protein n=2 Tax=Streptococcus suis TaxID=1307 RepID=UPI0013751B61|nr:phage tail spike protein [Streptococcus suis]
MISLKDKNVLLVNAFDDEIEQEGNGKYQLSFKYPTSDQRWKNIELADLLLADDLHGEQEFRVFEIVKRNGYIFVYANQVVDDLNSYSISNISVDRVNGQTVMQALAGSIIRKHPFAFYSDIQDRHVFNQKNISVMDALANGKHSIIGQWGGDLVRDKYNVNLLKRGGRESEALFMYKKNLKSYAETNSIRGLFTRLNLSVKDSDIKTTVDSPLIGSYGGRVYELNIEVADQDVTTLEQLQEYGRNYFAEKLIDIPNNSLTISVTDNQEYDVRIFDTVFVHHEIFDKDLRMKITSYRFSPMGRKLKSIGFGKIKTSLTQQVSNIATEVAEQSVSVAGQVFEEKLQKEIENADKVIDGKINKVRDEINDGIEQSKAEAEAYADNIKQQIDGQLAESNRQYQAEKQTQDRQIADVLAKAASAKEIAEQTVTDLMRVRNAFNQSIGQANTKALELERSIGTIRTDVMSQAQTILAQAQTQTELTNRAASVENTANSTKMTVSELSKTVSKATGDIASVSSRTKTVEDTLSQTRTQYDALTQTVNAQTGQIDNINRKTADLQSGIDGVTERFENLQVGGENLLLNAGFEGAKDRSETFAVGGVVYTNKLMPKWGSLYNSGISNPTTSYHAIYRESFNGKGPVIEFNESNGQRNRKGINAILRTEDFVAGNYMFSADVYATGPGTKIWFGFYYYNKRGSRSFHDGQTTVDITTTNSWHRVSGQIKLSDDIDTTKLMHLFIYAYNFASNSILYLTKPKLEEGTVATAFSLAQETIRSEIATYKRTAEESSAELSRQIQTVDGKAVDAKNYAQQTAEGFKTRLESLETYKDGESTRASQYFAASRDETARQVSALRTAVTDGYVAKAKYEEDARGVTQRFEEAQVGSVNLVINSKINETSNLYGFGIRRVRLEAGKKYWFGARARKNGGTADKKTRVYLYSSDWREERVLEFSNDEFTEKFTQFIPTRTQEYLVRSYWFPNGGDRSGHAEVDWYMVTEGTFKPSTWYPAPEDQQSYADTKIAEYKNTVDGQFTNLQSSINGKVSQADFQRVQTTSQLYERIIGSTEAGIKDKVARMVMADSLFLTEVKDKISGTATRVNQLSNSYAIKNLTSNGRILNQINLLANGTNRIDGRLTHITGQTLIDNGVIKNAMIGNLDAGKINTGTLNAARIATNSIDGSKLVFDQAFVNKMTANEALFKQLFAQSAFITSVQAVTMSASKIAGGILSALNGATEFNLQTGQISLKTDGASIQRIADGYPTHFLRFVNDATSYHSTTVLGASKTNTSPNDPTFAGMRIFNSKTKNSIVDLNAYSITFQQYPLATKGFFMDVANQELRPIDSTAQSKVSAKDFYIDSRSLATILDNIFDNFRNLNNNGNYTRNFYGTWR